MVQVCVAAANVPSSDELAHCLPKGSQLLSVQGVG
jgi:hypothetical protein